MSQRTSAVQNANTNPYQALVATIHEKAWPRHNDLSKGQTPGGSCNRPGCEGDEAWHWDGMHHAFYCAGCAAEINAGPMPSCELVTGKPSLEEMDRRNRYLVKAYRR